MKRREFVMLVAGAATWPFAARAQQSEQMRRIGVLMNRAANDAEGKARLTLFRQALQQLGWSEDRNIRIEICWGEDKVDLERKCAAELIGVAPDVILASGTESVIALQSLSRTLPIRAVTRPASCFTNTVLAGRCLNSSGRLHRA